MKEEREEAGREHWGRREERQGGRPEGGDSQGAVGSTLPRAHPQSFLGIPGAEL